MHYQDESNYHLNLNNKMIIIQMITLNVLHRIRRRRRRIEWQSHICSRKFRIVNIHVYHIQFHVQCSRNLAQPECCHEGIIFDKSQSQYAREWMPWCFIALERIGFEFKLRFQVLLVIMPTRERRRICTCASCAFSEHHNANACCIMKFSIRHRHQIAKLLSWNKQMEMFP